MLCVELDKVVAGRMTLASFVNSCHQLKAIQAIRYVVMAEINKIEQNFVRSWDEDVKPHYPNCTSDEFIARWIQAFRDCNLKTPRGFVDIIKTRIAMDRDGRLVKISLIINAFRRRIVLPTKFVSAT